MKRQIIVCAAVLALGLGAVTTAQAQYGPAYPRIYQPGLAPHRVIAIVRSTGMTPLSPPIRRGPNYVVIASDQRTGGRMRVVVNGYNGMIVRVRPVVAMRPYPRPYGAVAADPYAPRPRIAIARPREIKDPPPGVYGADPNGPRASADDGLTPLPPRSVPRARVATAPNSEVPPAAVPHAVAPRALAVRPPQTPLPRPRPAIASNDETTATVPTAANPPAAVPAQKGAWPVPEKPAENAPTVGEPRSDELKLVPVAPLD